MRGLLTLIFTLALTFALALGAQAQEAPPVGALPGSAAVDVVAPEAPVPVALPLTPSPSPEVAVPVPVAPVDVAPPISAEPSPVVVLSEPPVPWLSTLLSQILGALLPVLAAFLAGLLAWVLSIVARKLGISLDLAKDAAVRGAIRAAIGGAEEWAARRLKAGEPAASGADKLSWVLNAVSERFPGLVPDNLRRMVDEELAALPKVGATKSAVGGR
jgi:hypothetical protein